MNRPLVRIAGALLVLTCWMTSCNSEESSSASTADSNHCAITNVTLGNMRRLIHLTNVYGRDTTAVTIIAGNAYSMYIDQERMEIYNPDSLPMGTYVDKVVFSNITADGAVAYRTDWGTDTLYSSTDSLDFTQPRLFTCYSYSGLAKKTYTIHVNVHQVNPEYFAWNQVGEPLESLRNATAQRAFVKDDTLYVFALTGGEPRLLTSADGMEWQEQALTLTDFTPCNVQLFHNTFYALDGTTVVTSADGKTWTSTEAAISVTALPAVGSRQLFAVSDGEVYVSEDGQNWTLDAMEDNTQAAWPTEGYSSVCMPMTFNENFEYVLLAGQRDGKNVEWKKTIDKAGDNTEAWSPYLFDAAKMYAFPDVAQAQLLKYDEKVFALGCENDTLSLFYMSSDAGRTWIPQQTGYVHPANMQAAGFSCTVDEDNYIWIFCGGSGQVWRGRLNRLGFETHQTKFTE